MLLVGNLHNDQVSGISELCLNRVFVPGVASNLSPRLDNTTRTVIKDYPTNPSSKNEPPPPAADA